MDFIVLLREFGLPTLFLGVGTWLLMKGATVFWKDIVIPARDTLLKRIVDFFDKLDKTMDCTLSRHVDTIHAGERHEEITMRVMDKLEEVRGQCERIEKATTGTSQLWKPTRQRRPQPHDPPGGSTGSSGTPSSP